MRNVLSNTVIKRIDSCQAWSIKLEDRIYLQSYSTIICSVNADGKDLKRHWAGWSATTSKHIGKFLKKYSCNYSYQDYKALEVTEV